jgi:hypothetical protein
MSPSPKYRSDESGFNLTIRQDGRFTFTLTAVKHEIAINVARDFWGIMPGTVARMLRLEGPFDARGGY